MKVTVIKVSADGEQVSVEYQLGEKALMAHRDGKRHLRQELAPVFDLLDARLLEMNNRIIASNYLVQKLNPEARFAVSNVLDVLHGKTPGPAVQQVIEEARAERDAALKKMEEETEEVQGPKGEPTGKRRRKPPQEPVPQGREDGPDGISMEDLQRRIAEVTGGAE